MGKERWVADPTYELNNSSEAVLGSDGPQPMNALDVQPGQTIDINDPFQIKIYADGFGGLTLQGDIAIFDVGMLFFNIPLY